MGGQSLSQKLRVQGANHLPPYGTLTLRWEPFRHSPPCPYLRCGREPKSPKKTHADTGRTCKLHGQWPQLGFNFFLSSTSYWNLIVWGPAVLWLPETALGETIKQAKVCPWQAQLYAPSLALELFFPLFLSSSFLPLPFPNLPSRKIPE